MNILFLGARVKYEPFVQYCIDEGYPFIVTECAPNEVNESTWITAMDKCHMPEQYDEFFDVRWYRQLFEELGFLPDMIINLRDDVRYLEIERQLMQIYGTENQFDYLTFRFFSRKSVQDAVCKELMIPTVPDIMEDTDKVIVKLDEGFSGGTGFFVEEYGKVEAAPNQWCQLYQDISKTIGLHIFADRLGRLHFLNLHTITFDENNCPDVSLCPDREMMEAAPWHDYIDRLQDHLFVQNRLIFWQFMQTRDGFIYNMDFNCRPSGGFDARSFDTDTSNHDHVEYLIEQVTDVPPSIFHAEVICDYQKPQKFGYAPWIRTRRSLK